jgi:uncharacterized protein (DUF302 family)
MTTFLTALGGVVFGVVLMVILMMTTAPSLMIIENESRYSYEETIENIQNNAKELGWKIPAIHELHKAVASHGYDVARVAVLELCQPDHAAKILARDDARLVTSLMPCRISVYETSDGRVIMSRMNSNLIAQVFGGVIAEVMAEASTENEKMLENLVKN